MNAGSRASPTKASVLYRVNGEATALSLMSSISAPRRTPWPWPSMAQQRRRGGDSGRRPGDGEDQVPGPDDRRIAARAEDVNNLPLNNAVGTVVQGADMRNVDTVFIGGRIRKWCGELAGVELGRVRALAYESRDYLAARGWPPGHPDAGNRPWPAAEWAVNIADTGSPGHDVPPCPAILPLLSASQSECSGLTRAEVVCAR